MTGDSSPAGLFCRIDIDNDSQIRYYECIVTICVCANVSERQLDSVIDGGARSVNAVARRCGAGAGCGDCRGMIRDRLRQHRDACCAPLAESRPMSQPAAQPIQVAAVDELARVA